MVAVLVRFAVQQYLASPFYHGGSPPGSGDGPRLGGGS
jgi:hypothetical protein